MESNNYCRPQKRNPPGHFPEEVTEQEAVDPFIYGSPGKRGMERKRGPESAVVLLSIKWIIFTGHVTKRSLY